MISIIICSINSQLRKEIKRHIDETIGVEHEFIIVENEIEKHSITKAYNLAAEQAKYPYLCFCHEDIYFYTAEWGKNLIEDFKASGARLIGVLGSTIKPKYPSSVFIRDSGCNRWNQLQVYPSGKLHCYENPFNEQFSEVCTLDGLFIASTKEAWEETRFSDDYLTGFHGYDIDFSLKNFERGKVVVTFDILLEHLSLGSFNKAWIETQFVLNKLWEDKLPLCAAKVTEKDVKRATEASLKELMIVLVENNYSLLVQLKYFFLHLSYSPFDSINIVFLRKMIFRSKKLTNKLKALLKPKN